MDKTAGLVRVFKSVPPTLLKAELGAADGEASAKLPVYVLPDEPGLYALLVFVIGEYSELGAFWGLRPRLIVGGLRFGSDSVARGLC